MRQEVFGALSLLVLGCGKGGSVASCHNLGQLGGDV